MPRTQMFHVFSSVHMKKLGMLKTWEVLGMRLLKLLVMETLRSGSPENGAVGTVHITPRDSLQHTYMYVPTCIACACQWYGV